MSDVLADFAAEFDTCWVCSGPATDVHHIVRGVHREKAREKRCALFRCCRKCHQDKLDSMPVVDALAYKALMDPQGFDRQAVNLLRGRAADAISERDVALALSSLWWRRLIL